MSNVETAYEYFLKEGFTSAQSAGIVGNLEQESGVNPESVQPGGPGRGIAQWSLGGRWIPSLMTGNQPADLQAQLGYITDELQQDPSYGLKALQAASTPTQAAQVFGSSYERYGVAGARLQDAQNVYNQAQSNNWPTASSNAPIDATLTSSNGGAGDLWGALKQALGLSFLGPAGGALSDVGKIGEEVGAIVGYGAQKQDTTLSGNSFLDSVNQLLNPSVSLFNPFGVITMGMARAGIALFGMALIGAGVAIIVMHTQTGREIVGDAVGTGAKAALA